MPDYARNQLQQRDAALIILTVLPAAGAAVQSTSFDLGSVEPGPIARSLNVLVEIPATPALADTKNLTISLQDSADNITFAAIAGGPSFVSTGAGGAGAPAVSARLTLPASVRRYIRANYAEDAAGGNITGTSATLSLVF